MFRIPDVSGRRRCCGPGRSRGRVWHDTVRKDSGLEDTSAPDPVFPGHQMRRPSGGCTGIHQCFSESKPVIHGRARAPMRGAEMRIDRL